jgi:hypothetical protein
MVSLEDYLLNRCTYHIFYFSAKSWTNLYIQILISYEMYMGTRVKFRLWSFNSQTSSPTHTLSIYIEIMIAHISINYWPPSTIRGCTWQLKKEIIYRDTSFRSEQVTYMVLIMPYRFHFILRRNDYANLNQIWQD